MSWIFALAIYFVVWWIGLFAVLPFFAKPQNESETGEVVPGTPESAPVSVQIWKIALYNTLVATVIFAIIYLMIQYDPLGLGTPPEGLYN